MSALHRELKEFVVETLGLEGMSATDIGDDAPLFGEGGLGLDSIDALELSLSLKKRYGIVLEANDDSRRHLRSISTLAALIAPTVAA